LKQINSMPTFSEALLDEIRKHSAGDRAITREEMAAMVEAARVESMRGAKRVRVTLEGTQESVKLVAALLHEVFQVINEVPDQPDPERGFVIRQLMFEGVKNIVSDEAQPTHGTLSQPPPTTSTKLLHQTLRTVAQGLLDFPVDDQGRRQFASVYPSTFKVGLGHLSAYFLVNGLTLSSAIEYWRVLSQPVQDWPGVPDQLAFEEALIDNEGRTTPLTERLAASNIEKA
jgi:hypothetical protein